MKTPYICIPLVIFILCAVMHAQQPSKMIAGGGPDRIYVHLGREALSASFPVNGAVSYRLERRKKGEKNWIAIGECASPLSLAEFTARFTESAALAPEPLTPQEVPLTVVWERLAQWHRIDSIEAWQSVLQVRLALGITYCDTTVEKGIAYEYRVSALTAEKKAVTTLLSQPVSVAPKTAFPKIRCASKKTDQYKIEIQWGVGAGKKPASFSVYRIEAARTGFRPIRPVRSIVSGRDTLFLVMQDTTIRRLQNYAYYILPKDMYGNAGSPSDTVFISSTAINTIRLPDQISAQSLDTLGGIRLRWRVPQPDAVKAVKIFRSEYWEKGFQQINSLASAESTFVDRNVQPMSRYYYYLTITNSLDEESAPTAKVIGMYRSAFIPLPPTNMKAEAVKGGVRLRWNAPDNDIVGFYVFRSPEGTAAPVQISPLIPLSEKGETYSFTDTSRVLSGKISYAYTVRAESRSHVPGSFSDTMIVRPLIPTVPLTPVKLTAVRDGNRVRLYWQNMQENDGSVSGYEVYRRTLPSGKGAEFTKVNTLPLGVSNNFFVDGVEEGKAYEYAVRSLDYFGGSSQLSPAVQIELTAEVPPAPGGIRIEKGAAGVVIRWDRIDDPRIVSFKILRTQYPGKESVVGTVKNDVKEFADKTAKDGQLYFYKLVTVAKDGRESVPSRELPIRP